MAQSEVFLKPREAAAALGVSYAAMKQWILAGTVATVQTPGGHHRVPQSSIDKLQAVRGKVAQAVETTVAESDRVSSRARFRAVSGRNQLVGTIVEVKISGLLAKVVLAIGDQRITSIITADAAREMQLQKGQTAGALMKATEVMIVRV